MNPTEYVFNVSERDFQSVLARSSEALLLVDFWAEWCAPCRALAPVLQKIADDYQGRVLVAKVDADANQALTGQVGVRSLPTVIFVQDGQLVHQFTGAQPEQEVRRMVEALIGPPGAAAVVPEAAVEDAAADLAEVEDKLAAKPDDAGLLVRKADALARLGRASEARETLELVPVDERTSERGRKADARVELAEIAAAEGDDPLDVQARTAAGAAMSGGRREALDAFLEIMRTNRGYRDDLGRRGLVNTLALIDDAKLAGEYRRKMSALLF